jgi:hypothetical protein
LDTDRHCCVECDHRMEIITLLRGQYGLPLFKAKTIGEFLARAAMKFQSANGDYERIVLPDLTEAYRLIKKSSGKDFDPEKAALGELAWWVARRTPGQNSAGLVRFFIDKGADINAVNWANQTALMFAATRGSLQIADFLLQNGADPHIETNWKDTALIYAAGSGSIQIVRCILHSDPEGFASNELSAALIEAIEYRHLEIVSYLLAEGASPVYEDRNGWTGLSKAARTGDIAVMKELLNSGADVNTVDSKGRTLLDVAYGIDMRRYLRSR